MPAPVITFTNVSFRYGPTPALQDVNLAIDERDLTSIVGPNGGGKTTLLKLIAGLLAPESGRVAVFGHPPAAARARIGYMPQHARYDPLFPVTVLDVVMMGRLQRRRAGLARRADRAAARAALAEVDLAGLADRPYHALSGGQRQRVLLARAVAGDPALLLLDEPTASVDQVAEDRLYDILLRLNRRMTILMVSHDLGFVSQIVQHVICVNRRAVIHPTSSITGEVIAELYGVDLRMVRHDHRCAESGHGHAPAPAEEPAP